MVMMSPLRRVVVDRYSVVCAITKM